MNRKLSSLGILGKNLNANPKVPLSLGFVVYGFRSPQSAAVAIIKELQMQFVLGSLVLKCEAHREKTFMSLFSLQITNKQIYRLC